MSPANALPTGYLRTFAGVLLVVSAVVGLGFLVLFLTYDLGARAVPGIIGSPRGVPVKMGDARVFDLSAVTVWSVTLAILITNSIRRGSATVGLLIMLAATAMWWLDPIENWAIFSVWNPQLIHLPPSWPIARLSGTVQPVISLFGFMCFLLPPAIAGRWVVSRHILPRIRPDSYFRRHPLILVAAVTFPIAFLYNAGIEIAVIHQGLLAYSQVPAWGSVFAGTWYQFPLFWESGVGMLPAVAMAMLWWRDDTGLTVAERTVQKTPLRRLGRAPGVFLVFFAVGSALSLVPYVASFTVIRQAGWSTQTAQPWIFCEIKVPDPNGYFRLNGQPGPYVDGPRWQPAQGERPTRDGPAPATLCPETSKSGG